MIRDYGRPVIKRGDRVRRLEPTREVRTDRAGVPIAAWDAFVHPIGVVRDKIQAATRFGGVVLIVEPESPGFGSFLLRATDVALVDKPNPAPIQKTEVHPGDRVELVVDDPEFYDRTHSGTRVDRFGSRRRIVWDVGFGIQGTVLRCADDEDRSFDRRRKRGYIVLPDPPNEGEFYFARSGLRVLDPSLQSDPAGDQKRPQDGPESPRRAEPDGDGR